MDLTCTQGEESNSGSALLKNDPHPDSDSRIFDGFFCQNLVPELQGRAFWLPTRTACYVPGL